MSFSQPKYVRCPECYGDGEIEVEDGKMRVCPLCEGKQVVWDEQLPEENSKDNER